MEDEVSLERLDRQLSMSSRMLDDCAALIRDLELNPHENIRKIGEALARIFEIQRQIYERQPDLTPEYLTKGYKPKSGVEDAQDALAQLRSLAHGHRLYLAYLDLQISELKKRIRQDN
jgi:hypothetical protein